jgi:glycosyltransferase involved in cell wall biosynthesis
MTIKTEYKKFLFVIDNFNTGGAQRQLINLALGLIQRGYKVEIFCYAHGDLLAQPLKDAGIKFHWYFKRSRFSPDVVLALRNLINHGQFSLVLSFLPTPNFYAIVVGRLLNLNSVPVIVSERRCDLPQGPSLMERFARQFYRMAAHVITNSQHQRVHLVDQYPWLRNHLTTIYNGYDLQLFNPAATIPDNHPLSILAIARVESYKNILCLVEALKLLREHDNLLPRVDWIGELGTKGEQLKYLNDVKQAIQSYGLESQWQWLNQRTDIVDQLHQHDVLVHPSYIEGLPNVVCEALACALPVIVSDVLDHALIVQHGESGYLFNCKDPADLAEKIKLFINLSLDERKKMGQCGQKFAQANLSLDRFIDDYEVVFRNVLNE